MPPQPEEMRRRLTPEDVRSREFGTTRLRPGYDQHEVDAFLEIVEEELVDRDLQLEQALGNQTRWFDPTLPPGAETGRAPEPGQVSGAAATVEGTMSAAARLLEMAEESSASTVAESRREADRILARAQTEASTLLTAARRQADQITSDAHDHAARLQQSVEERQEQALRPLTEQRDELQRDIAGLRALALECRSRMRAYADEPLPGLDADSAGEATMQIGQMVPVPAGGTGPPSGHDSPAGAWTVPAARQGPAPGAAATQTSNGHRVPPKGTGSPAPDPDIERGGRGSARGDGPG